MSNWKIGDFGRTDIIESLVKIEHKYETEEELWIDKLRQEGYKASHPNDGWVNRKENTVHLCYPQFNDGLQVGDKMMLGWPNDYERPVKIIGIRNGILKYYEFEDIEATTIR